MIKSKYSLSNDEMNELSEIFGKRVNFSKRERHYYNHGVGTMPSLIKPLLGKVEPAAIVKLDFQRYAN